MAWQTLIEFTLSDYWQFSQPVEGDYIRVKFSNPAAIMGNGVICQANTDPIGRLLYGEKAIKPTQELQVIYVPKPQCFDTRVIGAKSKVFAPSESWSVLIEYWDLVYSSPDQSLPSVLDAGSF